jgi:AcrR family transcriptional regulator
MTTKQLLLDKAEALFHKYGVRSISMDEIAREMNMSKKTLYQYFEDKDDIVTQTTEQHVEREKLDFNEIFESSEDAIDELIKMSVCFRKNLTGLNPSLLFDLQKYHPKAWDKWINFKTEFIKNSVARTIERGMDEGYFRPNLNAEILAIFRMEQVEMTFNDKIFDPKKFDFTEVQMMLLDHFVHGLFTVKGQEIFDDLIKNDLNE